MAPAVIARLMSRVGLEPECARHVARMARDSSQRKYVWRWVRSRAPGHLVTTATPWITFDASEHLRRSTPRGGRVFEWGSGGSTRFWLSLGVHLVSVEHDPEWYAMLHPLLSSHPRLDYRLVAPEPAASPVQDVADPALYGSDDARYRRATFREYVRQIDAFPDGCFDVVLVDGRARPSCLVHAAPKVKVGGFLVLDNADTPYYLRKANQELTAFSPTWFHGAGPVSATFWSTLVLRRNA